jgi:hypothetical protein
MVLRKVVSVLLIQQIPDYPFYSVLPVTSVSVKVYIRGGQLFWLGGHFVEAEVGGGPHLLK